MNISTFVDKIKKVNGTFGDVGGCNEWAAFFSTYTIVQLSIIKEIASKLLKLLLIGIVISNVAVLLFTFSRGAYLAFVVGILYYFYRCRKFVYILLIMMLPLFYVTILPTAVVERINMSFQSTDTGDVADQDVVSRLTMWKKATEMFLESPVLGHGLLSFHFGHWNNPHNQHLNILVQGGVVGYLLFFWLFIASYREASYLYRVGADPFAKSFGLGMSVAVLSLFVVNIFGNRWSYYVLTGYFWVLNGFVYLLIDWSKNASTTSEVAPTK